ncbi:unnamed protein product [Malus baccata var. baccata]
MALRIPLLSPKLPHQPLKLHTNPFPSISKSHLSTATRPKTRTIHCTSSGGGSSSSNNGMMSDAELASDLSKMNSLLAQREEAMDKSRQLLFVELCQFVGSNSEEVKKKWGKLEEEEKMVLVKGFVSEWGVNFHPLSAKSVKQLVEEHVQEQNPKPANSKSSSSSAVSVLFPGFKRMMGFSDDDK